MRTQKPQQTQHERDELAIVVERVKHLFWKNGLHIALVASLLVLGAWALRYHELRGSTREMEDWQELLALPDNAQLAASAQQDAVLAEVRRNEAIAACRRIATSRPGTSARPWALLRLGGFLAGAGRWDEARVAYGELMRGASDSAAAEAARPAYAAVLEGMCRYAEAAARYRELAREGLTVHMFDAARCLELAGQAREAEQAYRQVLESESDEFLWPLAQARLAAMARGELLTLPSPAAGLKTRADELTDTPLLTSGVGQEPPETSALQGDTPAETGLAIGAPPSVPAESPVGPAGGL
jgi:tetratricopeptide (TPR) repeat protein